MATNLSQLKTIYRKSNKKFFPESIQLSLEKESDLRYGENPHQAAALYHPQNIINTTNPIVDIKLLKSGKEGLSSTNLMDLTRAFDILKYFKKTSVIVMKHANPSGFATQTSNEDLVALYASARDADSRSAFGSIVVFNTIVNKATAEEIVRSFIEVVAAPEFEEGAIEILQTKKDLRIIIFSGLESLPKFVGDDTHELFDLKMLPSGRVIVQEPYLTHIRSSEDLVFDSSVTKTDNQNISHEHTVARKPTENEIQDLLTAWYVAMGVRSNAVIFVKNGLTVSIGTGQTERVGAVEYAIIKAYQKAMDREGIPYGSIVGNGICMRDQLSHNPLEGAVCASDGFFPFRDSVDLMAQHGVTAIIQPGGSVNDHQVIDAVNERNMAMVITSERCFAHF